MSPLRRERDSNPRYAFGVYTLSRRASSTTRAPLLFNKKFFLLKNECKVRKIYNIQIISGRNFISGNFFFVKK